MNNTQFVTLPNGSIQTDYTAEEVLQSVYAALKEKGYNPVIQIVGYIMSGDPTYITNHKGARALIMKVERDELLSELVEHYINTAL
ncbi:MAG: IreB family regulatory phosphoprotein [Lachnospiraceae bacterium]|nr:IreB family regulatory phosphoprotein [Lachnospiraceae bacterium]